jgi:hypothetical protein
MTNKTAITLTIIIFCILFFPIVIGIIGGAFGIVFGIFGAVFGAIFGMVGAVIGAIFGALGALIKFVFGWPFGESCTLFDSDIFVIGALIIVAVLIARRKNLEARSKKL